MIDPGRKYNEFSLPMADDNTPKIHDLIANGKETLKTLKVYVPTIEYNSAMTFEQNLEEGKIKLMSELPVSDINSKNDPIQECMTSSKMHQDFSQFIHSSNQNISDFDALVNPNLQRIKTEQQSSSTNYFDTDNLSDTSQDDDKQHVCDVCDQKFNRRRDLALHYLTHSEKEKKRVTTKCDLCKKILKQCKCKKRGKKSPITNNFVQSDCISLSRPLNANTVFIKAESVSGKSDVIKRELFHCSECTQVFGLLSQMKQHLLAHKREKARKEMEGKSLTCNFCNKKCMSKSELLYHKSTVHPSNSDVV
ncbi:zinc finger protein 525 isoform X2 [Parasteatoda tepidariorum]|nr:zinc finger protein 813 isoform X2 [Parasteatoda tepidariorum]